MNRNKIIYEALKEYENNHYMNYGEEWQKTINELLDEYRISGVEKELTLIMRAGCDVYVELDKITDQIKELGGDVVRKEYEGVKRLAYEISGEARGDYNYFVVDIPKENVAPLANKLEINDKVLRFLLISPDNRKHRE